jgi:hypothetical protein
MYFGARKILGLKHHGMVKKIGKRCVVAVGLAQGGVDPDGPVLDNAEPIGGADPGSGSCSLEGFQSNIKFQDL